MQEKKIEFEKVIVHVQYRRILTKSDIEESCIRFLKKAMQDKEDQSVDHINTPGNICKKQILDRQA